MRTQQLICLAVTAACLVAAAPAAAEPYLMVRQGAKCSDCHTNETGGGKRTAFAHIHAKEILHDLDLLPIPAGVKPFHGDLNPYVSIGGDLRVRDTTVFEDRPNAQGHVPENKAFRRHVDSNDLSVQEFELYGQIDLWPDVLTLYVDEDLNGGANNREAFALIRGFLPWETYVKAGRFFPTYGLRVQDDQAFIRSDTGFTFDRYDEGVEIGLAPGPFFVASSITNGTGGDTDVLATINGYTLIDDVPVVRNVLLGGSFARISNKQNSLAFYAGSNLWDFTYLGELDIINNNIPFQPDTCPPTTQRCPPRNQLAAYAEVDWLLFDWLNLRGTFNFAQISNDRNETLYTIGAEPFINRFLQPIIQYRINNAPGYELEKNQAQLWIELHLFL